MKEKFAKLFDDTEFGQILITKDTTDDDKPQLSVKFWFEEVNGYCTYGFEYENTKEGLDNFEKAFNDADINFAIKVVKVVSQLK
jgi:hypothetical protein